MLKKIGAITAADFLTKVLGYLLLPIYLGLMPKVEFGEFGFLISALTYAAMIVGLYLYVPFIRNYCALDSESSKQELVSTIFVSLLIWLLFIDILLIALKPFLIELYADFFKITTSVDKKFYLAILLINSGIAALYCYSLLMARKTTSEIIVFTVAKFAVVSIFTLAILYNNPWQQDSVFNRLLSTAIAELSVVLVYTCTLFRPYLRLSVNRVLLRSNLRIAIPLIPSALIGLFIAVIDRRLIAQHHGLDDLADYNLALQALAPIQMLMSAIQVAWAPHLFSIKDNREALTESIRLMVIALSIMIAAALLVSLAIYIAINLNLISLEYKKVPSIILLASVGVIASALFHLNNNMFVHLGITRVLLAIALTLLASNWILNLVLVPILSTYGAAISAGASNILAFGIGLLVISKTVNREITKNAI